MTVTLLYTPAHKSRGHSTPGEYYTAVTAASWPRGVTNSVPHAFSLWYAVTSCSLDTSPVAIGVNGRPDSFLRPHSRHPHNHGDQRQDVRRSTDQPRQNGTSSALSAALCDASSTTSHVQAEFGIGVRLHPSPPAPALGAAQPAAECILSMPMQLLVSGEKTTSPSLVVVAPLNL